MEHRNLVERLPVRVPVAVSPIPTFLTNKAQKDNEEKENEKKKDI